MATSSPIKPGFRTARLAVLVGAGGADCRSLRKQGPEWTAKWVNVTASLLRRQGLLSGGCQGRVRPYNLTAAGERALIPHLLEELGDLRAGPKERADLQVLMAALEDGELAAVAVACQRLVVAAKAVRSAA